MRRSTPPSPPPVPPLADAAIARIERGLFAALDARPLARVASRRRGLAFALAGVAAAATVFTVREIRRGETLPARAAQISTTTSGSRIAIAGAMLEVAPQSAVSFGGGRDGAVVVVLDRGAVTCEVAPRTKRAPFIVEAGATRITVIGTRFSVHRVGEHATVTVEHGLVEVADTNMTELVHAGERFRPGEPVAREPLASEPVPAAPVATAPAAPLATPSVVPREEVASARPLRARAPHPRMLALGDAEPAHTAAAHVAAASVTAAAALPDAPVADAPATEGAPAPPAPPATEAPLAAQRRSVQVLFELAAQLEVRDPEAALRIYGELAAGEDGWAASALFAEARLESERGQTPRTRELCETYLRRFPHGPNADDARTLLASGH